MEKGGLENIRSEVNEMFKNGSSSVEVVSAMREKGYGIIGEDYLEKMAEQVNDFDEFMKKIAASGCALTRVRDE
jgi:hypothetical protein